MKKLLIASTSSLHKGQYLEYLLNELEEHFKNTKSILFIPYARPSGISHEEYTEIVKSAFSKINKNIVGIHEFDNAEDALLSAEGIFTGGGNTFLLVYQLYKNKIIDHLEDKLKKGTPYLGTSAGSNICGLTIGTTNDMPITYPPSFKTLGMVPFNINPHYQDPDLNSTHMGETRETRINEFHKFNPQPVIGLREGSWLDVAGEKILLKGKLTARWFLANQSAIELEPETDISKLL